MKSSSDVSAALADPAYLVLSKKILEGSVLGAAGITALTPLMYATARVADKQPIVWSQSMGSAKTYAAAVAPVTAIAYAADSVLSSLMKGDQDLSAAQKLTVSATAGAIAGIANTPFEVLAQDQQIGNSKLTARETMKRIVQANGRLAMLNGGAMVVSREASWAATYMTAGPLVSKAVQDAGYGKIAGVAAAAFSVGGLFGIASTPMYVLRYEKQKDLLTPKPKETYLSIAKRQGIKGLFGPWVPRTVTMVAATAIFTLGKDLVDQYSPLSNKRC